GRWPGRSSGDLQRLRHGQPDLPSEIEGCRDDLSRLHAPETAVVAERADAPQTATARHVNREDSRGNRPGRVLEVRERIEIDEGRPNRGGEMRGSRVVRD